MDKQTNYDKQRDESKRRLTDTICCPAVADSLKTKQLLKNRKTSIGMLLSTSLGHIYVSYKADYTKTNIFDFIR